ncbi:MAG: tRNA pseudouridine(55) synthase TruB [Acidobacteriota bacterium]|nr:tRNA pseudouridine(55) synthase TruB [Acidobacteriota bacterium]
MPFRAPSPTAEAPGAGEPVARDRPAPAEIGGGTLEGRLPEGGVLLIDKPAGITSHDVVAAVRRAMGRARTGHAGTLDPFATGLLLVLVGRATRIQERLMGLPKRYQVIARLGATSTTGDPEGEISLTGRIPPAGTPLPTGELRQRPPIYSAVRVGGERAYRRARRGESFEMPERIVSVHSFRELWRDESPAGALPGGEDSDAGALARLPRAAYAIECSSGTYVRSLIADLGDAYCEQLRRTAIGPFDVDHAIAPPSRGEDWRERPLLSAGQALEIAAG